MSDRSNKGSGLGVILFGITLLLILLFTAVNIVNSKVIENGYISLRDSVQSASSGSVIHLLTSERENSTQAQKNVISGVGGKPSYDIYLQLALGYLINTNVSNRSDDDTTIQTGEINNFIKLDHQKVVNSTLALLENAVIRRKKSTVGINDTEKYKIMMFFIEPYRDDNGKKFFNIIAYGNGNYVFDSSLGGKNISRQLATGIVDSEGKGNMKKVYEEVEKSISSIVNCTYDGMSEEDKRSYSTSSSFSINLNSQGSSDFEGLIREMETYPHYLIVVKDFSLPTIFDGKDTTDEGSGIKSLFTSLSGDGTLKTPMCALNTGKIQRQSEDANWSHL